VNGNFKILDVKGGYKDKRFLAKQGETINNSLEGEGGGLMGKMAGVTFLGWAISPSIFIKVVKWEVEFPVGVSLGDFFLLG